MATRAAPRPATGPSASATTGTVAMFATTHSQPGLRGTYVSRMSSRDFTDPPPPVPSTSRINGSRSSFAICSAWTCFWKIDASAAPPRTVKSSPPTTTGRPSMRARPMTKFAGVKPVSRPSSYSALPVSAPTSWKLPGSTSASMRSRTVSLPASC